MRAGFLLVALLAGCVGGSNEVVIDGVDGGGVVACERIPLASAVGALCRAGSADCGTGAFCTLDAWSGERRCRQLCLPEACEGTCGPSERCARPWLPDGQAPEVLDLDGDGVAESAPGVCRAEQTEPAPSFAMCGGSDALALRRGCDGGGLCARFFEVSVAGTCLPSCEGDCLPVDGYVPSCFDVGDAVRRCLLECSDELYASDCPTGMFCRPVQEGFALCVR